ncbi:hypothetical protein [Actinomadura rupiterrae]|uniref:hypothetical protein n=1 Tax=Actinomadura rupiterrae TaxID=559627 RepID=UPI0035591AC8|nr:hypothetical protein [Actinomadura rupiterrae]
MRALLAAGLPSRLIRQLLPCSEGDGGLRACPGVLDKLRAQLTALDEKADEIARARALLERTITRTTQAADPQPAQLH